MTIGNASVAENGGNLVFTVTLNNAVATGTSATYSFTDVTATGGGTDYTGTPGTVTFPPNVTTPQTITVPINNDALVEGNETFTVTLAAPTNGVGLSGSPATGTITDDDSATMTIGNASVAENGGNLVFTVTLNNAVATGTSATYSFTDVTATGGGTDYTGTPGTVTFPPNVTTPQTITVPINNDALVEGNETFTVTLAAPTNGVGLSGSPATGTITDDDSATMTIGNASVAENGGNLVFTVTLNNAVATGTSATYSFTDVTATGGGTDYTGTPGTVTFPPNVTTPQTITVPINNDALVEGNETFTVTLAAPTNGVGLSGSPATGTITDDDSATMTIGNASVAENGGNLVFTVTLNNAVATGTSATYSFTDVTATGGGTDYTGTPGTVTFPPNVTTPQTITVPINNDALVEGNETFTVTLAAPTNGVGLSGSPATGTITDDDSATMTIGNASVAENGGNLVFTVTLNNAVATGTSATYSFTDVTATGGGTDYTGTPGTVTFPPNVTTPQTITVPINNDALVEGNETFTVTLAAPTNGVGLSGSPATGTITDDDSATMTIGNASVAENGGNLVFTVTLNNAVATGTSATYSFTDVTATGGGTDYTGTPGTVTFPPNVTTPQTITVPINNDALVEGNETFTVTLAAPTNGVGLSGSPATGTITDDDSATMTIGNASVAENGGNLVFTVTLNNAVATGTSATYSFTDVTATGGGTDYTGTPGTVTFPPNVTTPQTITVPINNDALVEGNETFTVTLAAPTNGVGLSGSPATGTITDDDSATLSIAATIQAAEDATNGLFTITTSAQFPTATLVTFTVTGTATEGTDYTAIGTTVNFPANTNSVTLPVSVISDNFAETNETVIVTLTGTNNPDVTIGTTSAATITITDNDTAGVIITPTSGLVTTEDGESDVFTVTLTAQPTANVIIQLSSSDTSEGTVPASVTILPGQWNTGVDVIVTGVDDAILDGDIAFTIVTGNISSGDAAFNALTGASVADVSVTNTDDDTAAVTIADVGGLENGGPITVTAILDNATPGGFTVDVSTSDGSAVAGSDYSAIVSQTLTFVGTPGEQQTFTVSPIGDTNVEANETLTISMSNLASTILPVNITDVATVTINNDDSATLSIDDPTPIAEGNSGIQTIVFTVTLGQSDPNNPISVNYLISGGNEDTNTGTLNFIAGDIDLDRTISVTTNGDTVVEGDETISVTLSNPSINAILTKSIGSSSFTNDDNANISINDPAAVPEGDAGPSILNFTVSIDQSDPSSDINVDYTISGGNENGTGGFVTFPAGTPTLIQTISVTTTGDTSVEADEPITVLLSSPTGSAVITKALGSSSFTNDDTASVSINDPASVPEGNSGISTLNFTVSLDQADPNNNITIQYTISGGNEDTDTGTLTFVAGTTTLTQDIQVTTNGDTSVEADEPITVTLSGPSGNATIVKAVGTSSFTNDDSSTISISDPTPVLEGNTGIATINFAVTLGQADPNNPITVDYAISGGNENGTGGTLTFAANTTILTQNISVTTNGDFIVQANLPVTVTLSNPSGNSTLAADNIGSSSFTDDDIAGFTVSPLALTTTEGGAGQNFTVVLDAAPATNVVLLLSSSDTTEGTLSANSLTFNSGNWNTVRTVTAIPFNDDFVDGDQNYTITVGIDALNSNSFFDPTIANGNAVPDPLDDKIINVTNSDDDTVGIIITPINGNTTEDGVSASFTIFLESEPSGDVIIPLSSNDLGEGTIAVGGVTLNAANWDTGVSVVVTGVNDNFVDGPVLYAIVTGNVSSTDPNYDILTGANVPDVAVTNNDNDTASISINNRTFNEGIGSVEFTVTLTGEVEAGFTVDYATSNNTAQAGSDYTATSGTLTFARGHGGNTDSANTYY